MELQPKSESGKRLSKILSVWMNKSADFADDILKRVFFMYAFKLVNQDAFVNALFGQNVLKKSYLDEIQDQPVALSAVCHAISTSLKSRQVKELVVALEWSKNDTVLEDILTWAQEAGHKVPTDITASISIDLAPQRALKSFFWMLLGMPVTQRQREECWESKSGEVKCLRFEVCHYCNNIMIGFGSGEIKIYNELDLECEAMLSYYNKSSEVYCLQCTCTDIIAGYKDGSICAWDMKTGILKEKISVRNASGDGYPYRLRWQNPKLVVVIWDSFKNSIQTWQYINSSFMVLGKWSIKATPVKFIQFDDNYVVIQDDAIHRDLSVYSPCIYVYFPFGLLHKTIRVNATAIAYQNGKLITGGRDKILRIWDVQTGACLRELEGHDDQIDSVELQNNIVLSASHSSGAVTIWDMAKILGTSSDKPEPVNAASTVPLCWRKLVVTKSGDYKYLRLGRSFRLAWVGSTSKFAVIDFV